MGNQAEPIDITADFERQIMDKLEKSSPGLKKFWENGLAACQILSAMPADQVQAVHVAGMEVVGPDTIRYTFHPDQIRGTDELAPLTAGQYIFVYLFLDGQLVSRAYSVCSSPKQAEEGILQITVEKCEGGKASVWMHENLKPNDQLLISKPEGNFTTERIAEYDAQNAGNTKLEKEAWQDGSVQTEFSGKNSSWIHSSWAKKQNPSRLIAICAGSGITPFYSIAQDLKDQSLKAENDLPDSASQLEMVLLYGSLNINQILFQKELEQLNQSPLIQVVHVLSEEKPENTAKLQSQIQAEVTTGLLDRNLLEKHSDPQRDFYYICGPGPMAAFVMEELAALGVDSSRMIRDLPGETYQPSEFADYSAPENKTFAIRIKTGEGDPFQKITASANDSVLRSLEQYYLAPLAKCRSGQCGWCKSRLISGEIYVPKDRDQRTEKEKQDGMFCPCTSWPMSDLVIETAEIPKR